MWLEYRCFEMAEKERIYRPILASFIAALGPLSFGYCFSYSSSALLDLKSDDADSALRLTDSQGSWFSVSKHSFFCFCFFFFHCHEMLVWKELKQRPFWATQVNRKWRKDRLPPLSRDSKWRACSQAMRNSWLVVGAKLPREQPLIIIHIQNI